jgi:hypothetical protein
MLESKRKTEVGRLEVVGRPLEGAVGDRKRTADGRVATGPDPELVERPRRWTFTAKYELKVLGEADACTKPGEIGVVLRREGLYTSHLCAWRKQRDEGALHALSKAARTAWGRSSRRPDRQPRRRAERAESELEKARRVIEVQGNVSALLGELLDPSGAKPNTKP